MGDEAALRRRLSAEPANPEAMAELARVLAAHGGFAEARPLFESALALEPESEGLICDFAGALVQAGDLIAADFWLSRARGAAAQEARAELQPAKRRQAKALVRMARAMEQQGRLDRALALFRQALGHELQSLDWRLEAAQFMISIGRYAAAEAYLEEAADAPRAAEMIALARELRTRNPHRRSSGFLLQLHRAGQAELLAGRPVLAEPILRELTLCAPQARQAWVDLHSARQLLGKTAEADALRAQWADADPKSSRLVDLALSRPVSARGLIFDLRQRFPLAAKEDVLKRVETPAELKQASDAYLVIDPGGRRVVAEPFVQIGGEPAPPTISYATGESFVLALDNAIVAGRGVVVTRSGHVITDQLQPSKAAKYMGSVEGGAVMFGPGFGKEPLGGDYVDEPVFLCMGAGDTSYGDWLGDFPPRLWLAKVAELNCRLLVNRDAPQSFLDMLQAMGFGRDHILFQKEGRAVVYRRLYVPSWPSGIWEAPMANWLSIYRRVIRTPTSSPRRMIYLSRKNVEHRPLINEQEVCDLFVRNGFEEVVPETLSFSETLDLFCNPACIAGPWGSAFESVMFSHTPPVAVSLMPPYGAGYMRTVGIFMHEARVRFGYVMGHALDEGTRPNHMPWVMPMDGAKRALGRALELAQKEREREPA